MTDDEYDRLSRKLANDIGYLLEGNELDVVGGAMSNAIAMIMVNLFVDERTADAGIQAMANDAKSEFSVFVKLREEQIQ